MQGYQCIGVCSGWGAQVRACEEGPSRLLQWGLIEKLRALDIPVLSAELLYPLIQAKQRACALNQSLPLIHDINMRLSQSVASSIRSGNIPFCLGGDHSMAVGTWNGVYEALGETSLGLMWIDAHMDAHTEKTSPSGAWHGMPLAGLLGHGHPTLSAPLYKEPILLPEHVCLIGVRSFEKEEYALLQDLQVKIYFMEEVEKRGLKAILEEALQRMPEHFGVSFDLDVLDPKEAPGVGSPEEGGLLLQEVCGCLPSLVTGRKKLMCFELVEYNPERDHQEKTADATLQILSHVLKKEGWPL